MSKFEYTATGDDQKQHSGVLEAADEAAARSALLRLRLKPIVIKKVEKKKGEISIGIFDKSKKVKSKDLVIFTRQLATMINAGVPLVRSLSTMQAQTESEGLKRHLMQISKDVEGGMAFADALEKHSDIFNPIYINMIRAGEAGGILDEILKKLALQQEKDAAIRAKFKSAMTYPLVLITITVLVFIALMTVVVPKVGTIIADLTGGELPTMTKVMLGISHVLIDFWFVHVGVVVGTTIYLRKFLKTPTGRRKRDQLLLRLPGINIIVMKIIVARFSRIFASLMGAGVTVLDALEITARALGNAVVEKELLDSAKSVANGEPLSASLTKSKVFPPIVSQMLGIGEETGQTDTVLVKVADFYEEEVDAAVDGLSSILEPILIVVMGGMVGLIAASVIGPISSLANKI
ncbi:MAG TPA: type II secretion system F family protein [Candidatus Saccharibacteria bacterium]|nr:type II secretion system F family protein [Candidatus Saccharibacteria bacterium]HMT55505.1 type II secretion system F family protein [Candidatus Saccharibacteria bacterium]